MKRASETAFFDSRRTKKIKYVDNSIIRISPTEYYNVTTDPYILDKNKNNVVKPKFPGSKLVAQYYAFKYSSKIEFIAMEPEYYIVNSKSILNFTRTPIFSGMFEDRKSNEDFRKAYLLNMHEVHGIPLIYIRENGEEALVVLDSLGVSPNNNMYVHIANKTGLPIYYIEQASQADSYSCFTQSLVMARELTALNEKKEYALPNIISFIKNTNNDLHKKVNAITKLPNQLLKSCQISQFMNNYCENEQMIIHKKESLSEFRNRYTHKNINVGFFNKYTQVLEQSKHDIYAYCKDKGLKFRIVIEIQYYLNQIEDRVDLNETQKWDFINKTKKIMRTNNDFSIKSEQLYDFTIDFLKNLYIDVKHCA